MTTQTALIDTRDYGASLTSATLRAVTTDTLVATADSVNEVTADSGLYAAVFGEASVIAAGTYRLRAIISGQPITRYVTFAGTDGEVVQSRSERVAELDSSLTAQLQAIEDNTDAANGYLTSLLSRITSGVSQMWQDCIAMITGSGTADAGWDAAALSRAPSGSSTGDWTSEEKGQIRYRLGIDGTATAPTDPEADPIVITPATGIMTTGYLITRVQGVATAGITIRYQQAEEPSGDRGSSYDDKVYSAVSNSEGIAELSLVKGGLYYIWRSAAARPMSLKAYRVLNADGSIPDEILALPSHVGA